MYIDEQQWYETFSKSDIYSASINEDYYAESVVSRLDCNIKKLYQMHACHT